MKKEIKEKTAQEYREYTRDFLFNSFIPVAIIKNKEVIKDNAFKELPEGTLLYALINRKK
jgi:hypothetical protein